MPKDYVCTEVGITDPAEYEKYRPLRQQVLKHFGGRYIVCRGDPKVIEGGRDVQLAVVPEFESRQRAMEADYAEGPTFAMGLAKKLIRYARGPSLENFLEMESLARPALHATADNPEGVAAFKEERKPRFVGGSHR
jgi:uncharacterized protein (DUF1330 family)